MSNQHLHNLHKMHNILKQHRRPTSAQYLAEALGRSTKQIKRYYETLRDVFHAPILYIKSEGYKYDKNGETFELPGIWLSPQELMQLNTLLQLIEEFENNSLNEQFKNIKQEIHKLIESQNISADTLKGKVKILPTQKQTIKAHHLGTINEALVNNLRLHISYTSEQLNKTEREISPLRLIYYKENWLIDSYCHLRDELRQFKVACINTIKLTDTAAKSIPQYIQQEHFASSYGIYSGKPKHTAKLRFKNHTAQEMARTQWLPDQTGKWQDNDYILSFPYNNDTELIGEILKHTSNIEVLAPIELREKIQLTIQEMKEIYTKSEKTEATGHVLSNWLARVLTHSVI